MIQASKSKGRWVYYQPNDKDIKDEYGDCTIRALTKALNCTWLDAFLKTIPICIREQVSSVFGAPPKIERELMTELGFDYTGISNKAGTKRPTVEKFAKDHPEGTYIANVAHHVVAVVDGKYYDTWNCGYKSLYGYYTKREAKT